VKRTLRAEKISVGTMMLLTPFALACQRVSARLKLPENRRW
jgi:hypothetical protein